MVMKYKDIAVSKEQEIVIKETIRMLKSQKRAKNEIVAVLDSFVINSDDMRLKEYPENEIMESVLYGFGYDKETYNEKQKQMSSYENENTISYENKSDLKQEQTEDKENKKQNDEPEKDDMKDLTIRLLRCGCETLGTALGKGMGHAAVTIYKSGHDYIKNNNLRDMTEHAILVSTFAGILTGGAMFFDKMQEVENNGNAQGVENTDVPEKPNIEVDDKKSDDKKVEKSKDDIYKAVIDEHQKGSVKKHYTYEELKEMDTDSINKYIKDLNVPIAIQSIKYNNNGHDKKAFVAWAYGDGFEDMLNLTRNTTAAVEGFKLLTYTDSWKYKVPTVGCGVALIIRGEKSQWKPRSLEEIKEIMTLGETGMTDEQIETMYAKLEKASGLMTDLTTLYKAKDLQSKTSFTAEEQKIVNDAWNIQLKRGTDGEVEPRNDSIKGLIKEIRGIIYKDIDKKIVSDEFNFPMTPEGVVKASMAYTVSHFEIMRSDLSEQAEKLDMSYEFNPEDVNVPFVRELFSATYQRGSLSASLGSAYLTEDPGAYLYYMVVKADRSTKGRLAREIVGTLDYDSFNSKQINSLHKTLIEKEPELKEGIEALLPEATINLGKEKVKELDYAYIFSKTEEKRLENESFFNKTLNFFGFGRG